MRSGSATMSPTASVGFSEAYGSWKMYCMWRRTFRSRARGKARDLLAGERDAAARRGDEAHDRAAGRGLAASRLADQSDRLARPHACRLTPSTARTHPTRRRSRPALTGKGHLQAIDDEQRRIAAARGDFGFAAAATAGRAGASRAATSSA